MALFLKGVWVAQAYAFVKNSAEELSQKPKGCSKDDDDGLGPQRDDEV